MERRLLVLYASETGCAQDFAEEIGREGERHYLDVEVLPMDSYQVTKLPSEKCVIFVVSTTGQGDMPGNALNFWRFLLRKNLPGNSLQSVKIALCGLGDSGYKEFNFAAKKLYRRLLQLSAQVIIDPGYGDDQSPKGPYQVLDPWRDELFSIISTLYPLPSGKTLRGDERPDSKYIIDYSSSSLVVPNSLENHENVSKDYNFQNPYFSKLLCNKRLSAEDWQQDVRLYSFEINSSLSFSPGDSLAILPCNPRKEVIELLKRLNIPQDTIIHSLSMRKSGVKDTGPKSLSHLKFPMSIVDLLQNHLDIMGTPRRYFFKLLSYFANAEHEKERLEYFYTLEAQDELRLYNDKEKRSVLEVFQDFPSTYPPLEYLLDLIPPIQPRLFSLASSFKLNPYAADLLVATVSFKTPLKRIRLGLCTNWLKDLESGDNIRIWIKKGSPLFHLPKNENLPILMVGPGTGLAPFRSFIQEREWIQSNGGKLGWSGLFTGCRYKAKDWCFGEEFQNQVLNNVLSLYSVAFSRDDMILNNRKTYVQHHMKDHGAVIWNALSSGGYFFLSGSSVQMPKSVKEALVEIIQEHGKLSENEALEFIHKMEITGRFSSETWQ